MERPVVVTLCGSTRFMKEFQEANLAETLAGKIVLTIGCDTRTDRDIFGHLSEAEEKIIKAKLDVLHFAKIDLSDEVLILNRADYVGDSTRRELEYARMRGKSIRWLEESNYEFLLQALPEKRSGNRGAEPAAFPVPA